MAVVIVRRHDVPRSVRGRVMPRVSGECRLRVSAKERQRGERKVGQMRPSCFVPGRDCVAVVRTI